MNLLKRMMLLGILTTSSWSFAGTSAGPQISLDLYKSETCGCCKKWGAHLADNGIATKAYHPEKLTDTKDALGIPQRLRSCHTGVSEGGYYFEGHIPAKVITRFLASPPAGAAGLAVPGMPMGSVGMEMGTRFTPYDIIIVMKDGSTSVFDTMTSLEHQH